MLNVTQDGDTAIIPDRPWRTTDSLTAFGRLGSQVIHTGRSAEGGAFDLRVISWRTTDQEVRDAPRAYTQSIFIDHRGPSGDAGSSGLLVSGYSAFQVQLHLFDELPDGRLLLAWSEQTDAARNVIVQYLNANGTPSEGQIEFDGMEFVPQNVVELESGGHAVFGLDLARWGTEKGLRWQLFDEYDQPLGDSQSIASDPKFHGYGAEGRLLFQELADGKFMLLWNESQDWFDNYEDCNLYAQIFNADGSLDGLKLTIDNDMADIGAAGPAAIASRPGGGFSVSYIVYELGTPVHTPSGDPNSPGSDLVTVPDAHHELRIHLFDAAGQMIDDAISVAAPASSKFYPPVVEWMDRDRFNFVVSADRALTSTSYTIWLPADNGTDAADVLHGTSRDDVIGGFGERDQIHGYSGDDRLAGGAGADAIDGGAGFDMAMYNSARSGVIARLGSPAFNTGEAAGDSYVSIEGIVGSRFGDRLAGNQFGNWIDGGRGVDAMSGGDGDDVYRIDCRADRVIEASGQGRDRVLSGDCSVVLGDHFETGILTGERDLALIGNGLGNRLKGNAGDNLIRGEGGADTMSGGAGGDAFAFRSALDSTAAADRILDFTPGEDTIDLSRIDADGTLAGNQAFRAVSAFTGARGELRWCTLDRAGSANDQTIIEADLTGDARADMKIVLDGLVALGAGDFVL
jgi:serralysin